MAKITYRRRLALDEPDEVLTLAQRLLAPFKRQLKWLLLGAGGVALVLVAWGVHSRWQMQQEERAGAALTKVRPQLSLAEPAPEAMQTLAQIARDYPGTAAAREASLFRAHILYQTQKFGEAAQAYEALLRGEGSDWDLLIRESLSYCYEALGDFKKAAAALEPVSEKTTGPFRSELLRRLAWLHEKAGNRKEAGRYYQKLLQQSANSAFTSYLQEKVAAMEGAEKGEKK
jgi:predicted negative regulator of RcsB-dependent stress response